MRLPIIFGVLLFVGVASLVSSKFLSGFGGGLEMGGFKGCGLFIWRIIPLAVLWTFWKEMNGIIFKDISSYWEESIVVVRFSLTKLALTRMEFICLIGKHAFHVVG